MFRKDLGYHGHSDSGFFNVQNLPRQRKLIDTLEKYMLTGICRMLMYINLFYCIIK